MDIPLSRGKPILYDRPKYIVDNKVYVCCMRAKPKIQAAYKQQHILENDRYSVNQF